MEILAPSGSILALKAAIGGGANAVYLGLGEHNARIKSSDFTLDNLSKWVSYAHLFGVKVYVTLNTAVKDGELPRVIELARSATNCGADALIVSDLGAVKAISEVTDIPIHLSTQAGVQNVGDVATLKNLPIKRIILSRETPLSDIPEIKKYVEEVEVFVQGAMCVSFSGGCLLGSKIYGQSGNRGVCNQACRLTYIAKDESGRVLKTGKLLSPRDLSLGAKVRELAALGVDSIKIEGRLKRPTYVYSAVRYYREILEGKDGTSELRALSESFNRGYTDGYSLVKSKAIIETRTSSHIGVPIGEVISIEDRKGYKFAHVRSSYPISKGDGVKILRNGSEVGGSDVTSVRIEGDTYVIPVSDGVRKGDELRLTTNAAAVQAAESIRNTLPITLTIEGDVNTPLIIRADYAQYSVSVQSESVAESSHSADNSALIDKLIKLGNTVFHLEKVSDLTKQPIFLKTSELNALRRAITEKLRNAIIEGNTPKYHLFDRHMIEEKNRAIASIGAVFEINDLSFSAEYRSANAFVLSPNHLDRAEIMHFLSQAKGRKCYLRLPRIIRNDEFLSLKSFISSIENVGIYADTLYAVSIARSLGRGYIVGFGMNVFNHRTSAVFTDADAVCDSLEYVGAGDLSFRAGKVTLMSFAHCPFSVVYGKDCRSCDKKERIYYENDDGRYMILRRESVSCDFTMYEDKVTVYPKNGRKNLFYRFVGLNEGEKRDIMRIISEDISE